MVADQVGARHLPQRLPLTRILLDQAPELAERFRGQLACTSRGQRVHHLVWICLCHC
jgi:hypothetical protein